MKRECYECHVKTKDRLLSRHHLSPDQAERFTHQFDGYIQRNWQAGNLVIATHIHRMAREIIKNDDLYREEKNSATLFLLERYDRLKSMVLQNENPLQTAAKLAAIGNIIDYGAHAVPEDLEEFLDAKLKEPLAIDHRKNMIEALQKAQSILYLADNAGEIVLDRLFLEILDHPHVVVAVRGQPVINDVTLDDAQLSGIDKISTLISNGYDAPSTLLGHCSDDFTQAYHEADVVISKGQGNFEGLMNEKDKILFFMLMAKCNPIARLLGVKKGSMVIRQNSASWPLK